MLYSRLHQLRRLQTGSTCQQGAKKAILHQKLKRAQPQKKCIHSLKIEMYIGQLI